MALTIAKCFGTLIATGNGQKCNNMRMNVRLYLNQKDEITGEIRSDIWKNGSKSDEMAQSQIADQVGKIVSSYLTDSINNCDTDEMNDFKNEVEKLLKKGFWNGFVGMC